MLAGYLTDLLVWLLPKQSIFIFTRSVCVGFATPFPLVELVDVESTQHGNQDWHCNDTIMFRVWKHIPSLAAQSKIVTI
jgi:hypothetical protein